MYEMGWGLLCGKKDFSVGRDLCGIGGKVCVGGGVYPVEGEDCYVGENYHVDTGRFCRANQTQNESGIVLDSIIVPRAHTCNEIKRAHWFGDWQSYVYETLECVKSAQQLLAMPLKWRAPMRGVEM